jgi:hypothetical protein
MDELHINIIFNRELSCVPAIYPLAELYLMKLGQINGYHISIAASALAAVAIAVFYFWIPAWAPASDAQMRSDFAVMWVLLTYLWVQTGIHIIYGPATRNQVLLDMLSSIIPLLVIGYVIAEYYKGDLRVSTFQINAAWLTAYAMLLDLVLDMSLAISQRRQA